MLKKRKCNFLPVVKKHIERAANFAWSKILTDPRSKVNRKLDLGYAIKTLFLGIMSGEKNLRGIEDFSEMCGERIPDTTLNNLILEIDPEPLRELLVKEVKSALRDHELPKDAFPVRITAIDGKCISVSRKSVGEFSQESRCNDGAQYLNRALRAFHVSNDTTLCIGQREIHGKTAEVSEFAAFVQTLLDGYRNTSLLEVISVDAGMTSKQNADFLISNKLDYVMALKGPQKTLFANAKKLLGSRSEPDKVTIDNTNGKVISRELYRCSVDSADAYGWSHLREFWRIRQVTTSGAKNTKPKVEERFFLSSLPKEKLNDSQVMQAIRMHWRIENNGNWITDTVFSEDSCPFANRALVLVSMMRMLAYNVVSRLKTRRLRKAEDRQRSWRGIMGFIKLVATGLLQTYLPSVDDQPAFS